MRQYEMKAAIGSRLNETTMLARYSVCVYIYYDARSLLGDNGVEMPRGKPQDSADPKTSSCGAETGASFAFWHPIFSTTTRAMADKTWFIRKAQLGDEVGIGHLCSDRL